MVIYQFVFGIMGGILAFFDIAFLAAFLTVIFHSDSEAVCNSIGLILGFFLMPLWAYCMFTNITNISIFDFVCCLVIISLTCICFKLDSRTNNLKLSKIVNIKH